MEKLIFFLGLLYIFPVEMTILEKGDRKTSIHFQFPTGKLIFFSDLLYPDLSFVVPIGISIQKKVDYKTTINFRYHYLGACQRRLFHKPILYI